MPNASDSSPRALTFIKTAPHITPPTASMASKKAAPKKPTVWHVVRRSSIHSRGVFARCDIPKNTQVLEYTGEKISKAESERRAQARLIRARKTGVAAVYIFNLNKKQDLDGSSAKNTARLLNHSCAPNCEAIQSRGRILADRLARHPARRGVDLQLRLRPGELEDHPCLCGTDRCVGYIADETLWPDLLKKLEARAQEVRNQRKTASAKDKPERVREDGVERPRNGSISSESQTKGESCQTRRHLRAAPWSAERGTKLRFAGVMDVRVNPLPVPQHSLSLFCRLTRSAPFQWPHLEFLELCNMIHTTLFISHLTQER